MALECKQCGYCCKVVVLKMNPRTDKEQHDLMKMRATYIKSVKHAGFIWVVLHGQCIHLAGRASDRQHKWHCKNYDDRPQRCKDWPRECKALWRTIHPECGMV